MTDDELKTDNRQFNLRSLDFYVNINNLSFISAKKQLYEFLLRLPIKFT
jgi:hypothetical protein